jgi:hypothetical protein
MAALHQRPTQAGGISYGRIGGERRAGHAPEPDAGGIRAFAKFPESVFEYCTGTYSICLRETGVSFGGRPYRLVNSLPPQTLPVLKAQS